MMANEYNCLKTYQKAQIVGSISTFLTSYADKQYCSSLYTYNNFYIEVLWSVKTNILIEIYAFRSDKRLDKYLDRISLESLTH